MTSGEVEWILGEDHSWDEDDDTLTWDYGLVKFLWHTEVGQRQEEVGQRFVVRTRHLTFRLPFDDLRAVVDLGEAGPPSGGVQEYRHPVTGVVVRADLASGDVHEILGWPPDSREPPNSPELPDSHQPSDSHERPEAHESSDNRDPREPSNSRALPEPRDMPKVHTSPVFFADIVRTGTVLGVDAEMQPEVVRRVLGEPDYTNETIGGLSWGYGLLELFWSSASPGRARRTYHFSVQAHRLSWTRRTVRFADLRTELDGRGIELVELADSQPDPDYAEYWHPKTRIVVTVYLPEDKVYRVQSRFRTDYSAPSPTADHRTVQRSAKNSTKNTVQRSTTDTVRQSTTKTVQQSIKEVVNLSDKARLAWIERTRPAEHPEQWWLRHCLQISGRAAESDDPRWLTFALWAWAQPMGIAPAEHAWEVAMFVRSVEGHLPAVDRPSADSVVRACLAEVTGTTSPIDKTLVSAAEQHRHAVEDPALLADLDRWIAARADIPSASVPDL